MNTNLHLIMFARSYASNDSVVPASPSPLPSPSGRGRIASSLLEMASAEFAPAQSEQPVLWTAVPSPWGEDQGEGKGTARNTKREIHFSIPRAKTVTC